MIEELERKIEEFEQKIEAQAVRGWQERWQDDNVKRDLQVAEIRLKQAGSKHHS